MTLRAKLGLLLLGLLALFLVAIQFAAGGGAGASLGRLFTVALALVAAGVELWRPRSGGGLLLVGTALLLLPPWLAGDSEGSLLVALAWWGAWSWRRVAGPIDPRWWAGGMALAALLSALLYRLGGSVGRLTLPLHWHNPSAALFATAVPVCLVLAARARGPWRWVWAGGAAALLLAVSLTQSRAGLAVALLALPLLPWLLGGAKRAVGAWRLAVGATVAALGAGVAFLGPRLADLFLGGHSAASRLAYAKGALALGAGEPWLGVGWGQFGLRYPSVQAAVEYGALDPHSWLLRAWAEGGVGGLALAGALAAGLVAALRRAGGRSPEERALLLGALALALHGLVDFDATYLPLPFVLGALWGWGDAPLAAAGGRGRAARAAAALGLLATLLLATRLVPPAPCREAVPAPCVDALVRRGTGFLPSRRDLWAAWERAPAQGALVDRLAAVLPAFPHEAGLRVAVGSQAAAQGSRHARPLLAAALALDPLNRPEAAWALAADLSSRRPVDRARALAVVEAALLPWPEFGDPEEVFSYLLDARARRLDVTLGLLWGLRASLLPEGDPEAERSAALARGLLGADPPAAGGDPDTL